MLLGLIPSPAPAKKFRGRPQNRPRDTSGAQEFAGNLFLRILPGSRSQEILALLRVIMAIIDPEGLFSGERLAACSDLAQLYWPRFFLAANSCGRIELSYKSLVSRVFGNFQDHPKSDELWAVFREYENNFLAVLYESDSGVWWCQFITSEKFLPKYKKTRDEQSPAPTSEVMEAHRRGYLEWKRSKSFKNQSFQKLPTLFSSEGVGIGVGVGTGIGVGVEKQEQQQKPSPPRSEDGGGKKAEPVPPSKPTTPPKPPMAKPEKAKKSHADPRYEPCKDLLRAYWLSKNPEHEMPWDGQEGKALSMFLKANPHVTATDFRNFLAHRFRSEVNHSERPGAWVGKVIKYANHPLDRFGQPIDGKGKSKNATVPLGKAEGNLAVLAEVISRRQRERTAGEDGDIPAGEVGTNQPRIIHAIPSEPRPPSVSGGDGDSSGKQERGRGDGAPIPW